MKITNNSIIDSVIDYANVKFGMEMKQEDVSKQLKLLSYKDTLQLVDAITQENDEKFSEIIDMSAMSEAYGTATTATPSRATARMGNQSAKNAARRSDNYSMKDARSGTGAERTVAGAGNMKATGTGSNANKIGKDPDDIDRAANKGQSMANADAINAQQAEIERLKKQAGIRR